MAETARTVRRVIGAVAAISALAAASTAVVVPASAGAGPSTPKFCQILSSDQGSGIDFEGLGRQEAKYAAKLNRKLAKSGVPAKLRSDLEKLASVYDRIAKGEAASKVIGQEQKLISKALTRMTRYTAANCVPNTPSS